MRTLLLYLPSCEDQLRPSEIMLTRFGYFICTYSKSKLKVYVLLSQSGSIDILLAVTRYEHNL